MARFSFGIFGQNSDELISGLDVQIRDSGDTVIADKSGNLAHTITDNGDGTYFVDTLTQALYSVYVGDSAQDELSNIFFVTEATQSHIDDDTKHRLIDDAGTGATATYSNQKVITLLATKSATTHNHSGTYAPDSHSHLGYVETGGDGITVSTIGGSTTAEIDADSNFEITSGKLSMVQNYSGQSFINPGDTIGQNIQALDSVLSNVEGVTGAGMKKLIFGLYDGPNIAGTSAGDEAPVDNPTIWLADESSGDYEVKIQFRFFKENDEIKIFIGGEIKGEDLEGSSS